ncbi:MAG: hypothetical protein A4E67_02010 [Syntrophaceae bacterium PtaB.Bin038]|nr:MAG: hypothetical protein A4E67_02010 [Syntrophaceae bacterium PtaB.Bin038]
MPSDDPVGRGKPEAATPPHLPGGEEGLEDPLLGPLVDAHPRVRDGDHDVVARLDLVVADVGLVEGDVPRFQGQFPAARHGLLCVDVEIDEDLLDLHLVDLDGPDVALERLVDRDVLAGLPEGVRGLLDDVVEVAGLDLVTAAAGERQELVGEVGAALDLLLDALEPPVGRVVGLCLREHQRRVALDAHEDVVEGVRDASGQRGHGLHVLRVEQFGLHLLEVRDVLVGHELLAVAEDHHAGVHDPVGAAPHADRHDALPHLAVLREVLQVLAVEVPYEVPVRGVWEDPLEERLGVGQVLDGIAEDLGETGVQVLENPVGPGQGDAHGRVVREHPEALLALDEGVLDALAVRDVGEHDHGAPLVDARRPEFEDLGCAVPAGDVEDSGAAPDVGRHVGLPGLDDLLAVLGIGERLPEPLPPRGDVLEGIARDPDELRVDVDELALFAEQQDAVGRFLDDGPEGLALVLERLLQFRDALLEGRQRLTGFVLSLVPDHSPLSPFHLLNEMIPR